MIRFLHSADLHIGKPFGTMPDALRPRLQEARHGVLDTLAAAARQHGADTILLAGDTFDTETPSPMVLRQALGAMAGHAPLRWVILPGNHDSLLAEALWSGVRAKLPENVTLVTNAEPLALWPSGVLLPAPCTARRPGRDLTAWMDYAPTPEGLCRIGLAHGAIQRFSEEDSGEDIIAPDRAALAGLDYLALGDWHGQLGINARTWYAGTPEPDRFKHEAGGRALLVSLEGAGAPPKVEPVETAAFAWKTLTLDFLSGEETDAGFASQLPVGARRRQTLVRLRAQGRLRPLSRAALDAAVEELAPEFALMELDASALRTDCAREDLDAIDRAGALRQAAEALLAQSEDQDAQDASREIAREALVRLFSYCEDIS